MVLPLAVLAVLVGVFALQVAVQLTAALHNASPIASFILIASFIRSDRIIPNDLISNLQSNARARSGVREVREIPSV